MLTEDERQMHLARSISDATTTCKRCETPVFWATTFPKGNRILLEAEQGGGFLVRLGTNKLIALADPRGHLEGSHHRNHWSRCKP